MAKDWTFDETLTNLFRLYDIYDAVHVALDEGVSFSDALDKQGWTGNKVSYADWNGYITQRILNAVNSLRLVHLKNKETQVNGQ